MRIVAIIAILAGLGQAALAEPVTVRSCDRVLTFETQPQAAVSHDVNMTEMMLVLGLADRMVGYTGISNWKTLDEALMAGLGSLPEISPGYPTREVLAGAGADFLFAGWNYGMRIGGEVTPETLAPLGIQVYELTESCIHLGSMPSVSMETMYRDLLNVGAIFGEGERAAMLVASYRAQMEEIAGKLPNDAPPRVFVYDSGEDAPFTAGRYAMPTALIEAAGGRNIMDDLDKSWATIGWESVVERNPEVIVIVDYGSVTARQKMDFMRANPAFAEIDAVRNNRFVVLEYVEATPGPRNIAAVGKLAEGFHGR